MDARVYIDRRELVNGFGALLITSLLPRSIPQSAKIVRVVCTCQHADETWVVFDDLPQTIFRLVDDYSIKPGMEFLA